MRRALLAAAMLAWALAGRAAEPQVVREVVVVGGKTITAETVEYYLGVAEGDDYDPVAITGSFQRFWDSGLVEDLKIEVEDVAPGEVRVIVTVTERPKVSEFAFEGNKKLSTSTVKEKLDTAGIQLKRNVPLRESEVQRVRRALEEAYAAEGYSSAKIEPVVEEVGANLRKVTFRIDEGVKVKIGEINFEGNEIYSDGKLRGSMKKIKEKSLLYTFSKKTIWSQENWGEDSENVKKYYRNRGYKDIIVGEPKVELVARNPEGETQKKKKFRAVVTVPVQEGDRFKLGSLKLSGNTVFNEAQLRRLYEVEAGGEDWYHYGKIEQGNEAVRNLYQGRGYIYAYTNQVTTPAEQGGDVTDVTVRIFEGDRYKLGRLEFAGNNKTQEKVLRREFRLAEGDWMDMGTFRRSVFKVNQLGYFKLTEDPLEFAFDDANRLVNVTVKGNEIGRTDIQFGAGYSELDKFFAQFMFNTRNFLGRGEVLGVAVSTGMRADSYSVSFSEPYFLDRRMVVGGSLYDTTQDLETYEREARGLSAVWGASVGIFGQFSVSYGLEDVFSRYVTARRLEPGQGPPIPQQRPLPPPYKDMPTPELFYDEYSGVTSSLTPAYYMDSRDDPFEPTRGTMYFGRLRWAGGLLGGDFHYLRPEVGLVHFRPLTRRYIVALNAEAGYIWPFEESEIPFYDRYRLGGERSLRGFGVYEVVPRTELGRYFLTESGAISGGDRYVQLNLEFQVKVGGPLRFILFTDVGNTYHETQGWDFSLMRYSAGAELRIFLPIFQAPLRFIYGVNLDPFPDEEPSDFQFSIGTTF
ncbi:MAG: bamA 2 [Acidobacteria bacterium]|nr:bamA 2 [Acidobacteriota bacterium]